MNTPPVNPPDDAPLLPTDITSVLGSPGAAESQEFDLGFLQPSNRPDAVGRLGHYEILQVLGQGGFGIVFRAFDDVLQRVVAIKVLAPTIAATSPARKRFLREARSAAQVRHENVVQIYAVEELPLPYLVMEFIPGETLEQRLNRSGPFDAAEVADIGRQTAEGLAAAHAAGLIHRDIKPSNILLETATRLRVKITDFGLARAADDASLTQSGMVAGTPQFMSPEQARGEALDHRTDLFSLGSVLYTITTGRPPFRASNTVAILMRVNEDTPRAIQELIPETPKWLCDVIERLMAKDRDDRIPSARLVADVLADGPRGRADVGSPNRPAASPPPRPAGRRIVLALAVGLAVAVVGVGAYLTSGSFAGKPAGTSPEPVSTAGKDAPPSPVPPAGTRTPTPPERPEGSTKKPAVAAKKPDVPAKVLPPVPTVGRNRVAELLGSPDNEWSQPTMLESGINTDKRDFMVTLTADERTIVFVRETALYWSQRERADAEFPEAKPVFNTNSGVMESPTISGDGLVLVYTVMTRNEKQEPEVTTMMSKRKSVNEMFGKPDNLPRNFVQKSWEKSPLLSSDGLTLLLTVPFWPDGPGAAEIIELTRPTCDDRFAVVGLIPGKVNTNLYDAACWLSDDKRTLISTSAGNGTTTTRIHVRPSADAPFEEGKPFPFPANPNNKPIENARPWLSPNGVRMYFHSREIPNGMGELDVWMSVRTAKK